MPSTGIGTIAICDIFTNITHYIGPSYTEQIPKKFIQYSSFIFLKKYI